MGTNYHLNYKLCPKCGRGEEIHLGKSSAGWKFVLQYNDGKYYKNWEEMQVWLKERIDGGDEIRNEYEDKINLKDFINEVEQKQKEDGLGTEIDMVINNFRFCNEEFS